MTLHAKVIDIPAPSRTSFGRALNVTGFQKNRGQADRDNSLAMTEQWAEEVLGADGAGHDNNGSADGERIRRII